MPIKIKTQRDYLTTEVTIDAATADLAELDQLMRLSKSTGKIVAVYSQGGLMNVNLDQKSHIAEKVSEEVRKKVGVNNKDFD